MHELLHLLQFLLGLEEKESVEVSLHVGRKPSITDIGKGEQERTNVSSMRDNRTKDAFSVDLSLRGEEDQRAKKEESQGKDEPSFPKSTQGSGKEERRRR